MKLSLKIGARAATLFVLALAAAAPAMARRENLQTGYSGLTLNNLRLVTSPIGNTTDGGFERLPGASGHYAVDLLSTSGQRWHEEAAHPGSAFLERNYGNGDDAWAGTVWNPRNDVFTVNSSLSVTPPGRDWAEASADLALQTTYRLAAHTRLTINADLEINAFTQDSPWRQVTYDFRSILLPAGSTEGQSIVRSGVGEPRGDGPFTQSFSLTVENPGDQPLDVLWQREASTFVGALAVPEPAPISMALAGGGVLLLVARRRRR